MGRNIEPPRDIITHIKKLEKRIENLERSQRISNTSIDEGSVVVNNGAIVSKHPNGVELFRAGQGETTLPFEVDPTPGYLTRIKRGNGQTVFEVFSDADGGESRLTIHDKNGNQLFAEDWLIGKGIGRPFIPLNGYKVSEWLTPPDIVTAASFTGVYIIEFNLQHPAVYVNLRCTTGADVTGEVRLRDTFFGQDLWTASVGTNFSGNLEGQGNVNGLRTYGNNMSLELQARKTAGVGNMRLHLVMTYGRNALTI